MTLAISAKHERLLRALAKGSDAPKIVVIGAAALRHHVPTLRATADVDLVIVSELPQISALLGTHGWKPDKNLAQRWRDPDEDAYVDILPGTPEVVGSGKVRLSDGRVLSTAGFDLALRTASPVEIGGGDAIDVASLPAIIVLKMAAWLDRPDERRKDLEDLGTTFNDALEEWDDRRWEGEIAELNHEEQVAFWVGQKVAAEAERQHYELIERFLEELARRNWTSIVGVGRLICTDPNDVVERRLAAFRRGLSPARR